MIKLVGRNSFKIDTAREFKDVARELVRFGAYRFSANKLRWIWSRGFVRSDDWKRLRYKAIKRYGGRCMACGRKAEDTTINVDHIRPRRLYPERALSPRQSPGALRRLQLRQG